jgi:8-oxo-dGTP pyrophosphatase MutT (NUDIX family)
MVVRDTALGPEVFVQERAATMAFAPAMVVFPGGRVDDADAGAPVDEGLLSGLAARMGVPAEQARAIVGAALREVEEECGVRLSADALRPRARWLTPVMEPRRYDTWFFAARMPEGQHAVGETRETTSDHWGRAEVLLEAGRARRLRLMPPTIVALEQFGEFGSVEHFLADTPSMALVEPQLVEPDSGYVLRSQIP